MDVAYAETNDAIKDEAEKLAGATGIEGLAIFVTSENTVSESFSSFLQTLDVPIFGGVFPEVIYRGAKQETGGVVCGLTTKPNVTTISGLSDPGRQYTAQLDPDLSVDGYETAFVFVDAYATGIERFVDSLFRTYSVELNYIGGGAGTLAMEQQPCLFTSDGIVEDSAVVAGVDSPLKLGVNHGWKEIAGPFRVTDAEGPTVQTLDGTPAFSVYQQTVNQHASAELTRENFFDIAKGYPFGITRMDGEQIVRDPFEVTDENGLNCFGDVPEGEFVNILEGHPESLIDAAQAAKEQTEVDETDAEALLFFDCISRVLYLEDDYDRELERVRTAGTPTVGALTIGEIANNGAGHLDYYNKTAVVGSIEGI